MHLLYIAGFLISSLVTAMDQEAATCCSGISHCFSSALKLHQPNRIEVSRPVRSETINSAPYERIPENPVLISDPTKTQEQPSAPLSYIQKQEREIDLLITELNTNLNRTRQEAIINQIAEINQTILLRLDKEERTQQRLRDTSNLHSSYKPLVEKLTFGQAQLFYRTVWRYPNK